MAAPTRVSYTETAAWNTAGTSKATVAVTWLAGDILTVMALAENSCTLGTPTATGLTFAKNKNIANASRVAGFVATAVAGANGSQAVTVTNSSGVLHWGFGVWVHRNSAGVGNSAVDDGTGSAKTLSLTPTAADSAIIWGVGDFNADAVQSITPTPTNTDENSLDTPHYTIYAADIEDQTSAGAVLYGVTGGASTGPFTIVIQEIKAGTSAPTQAPFAIRVAGVGPTILRGSRRFYQPPINDAPLTDLGAGFVFPANPGNRWTGPQRLRAPQFQHSLTWDDRAPVTDTNFVYPVLTPSRWVGPQVFRNPLYQHALTWNDQAARTDDNFGIRVPAIWVGPMVGRSPRFGRRAFPTLLDIAAAAGANQTLLLGNAFVTISAPGGTVRLAGAVSVLAGPNTVTITAPAGTVRLTTVTLPTGQQVVTITAPPGTVRLAGNVTRVAATNTIVFSAPTAVRIATRTLAGTTNVITFTAPAGTLILPGGTSLLAGSPFVLFTAPSVVLIDSGAGGGGSGFELMSRYRWRFGIRP